MLQAGTRQPLPGVRVTLKEKPELSAVTDNQGVFELPLSTAGRFTAILPGADEKLFKPAAFSVGQDNRSPAITLYFESDIMALPAIVIFANSDKDKVGKRVVSGEELREVPGGMGDPLKAMQTLPGVAVGNDASSNPAIRGTSPDDNVYFVDNYPAGYLFHMGDLLSVFNADLVSDFTIHPSAAGPEFDSVIGAVIDVHLRNPRVDRFGGKVNVSAYESDVLLEGPVGKNQSFLVAGRRSYLDLVVPMFTKSFGNGIDIVQFPEFYDYQGKYVWRLGGDDALSFETTGAWDKMALDVKSTSNAALKDPDLAGRFGVSQAYDSQGMTWTADLSPQVSSRLTAAHLDWGVDLQAANLGKVRVFGDSYCLHEQAVFRPTESHTITAGYRQYYSDTRVDIDFKYTFPSDFDPNTDFTSATRKQANDHLYLNDYLFYAKDRWEILPRLTLLGGGRATYDQFLKERRAEPWTGTEFSLAENTLLTGGWGIYHESPPPWELLKPFGNPDLESLRAQHYVAGVRQQFPDGWSAQAEVYRKTFTNLVVEDPAVNYVNGASGKAQGVEVLIKKEKTGRWNGWLSVSQSHSVRTNDLTGQTIDFKDDQPWIVNLVATCWFTKKISGGLAWRYHTGEPWTPVAGSYVDTTGRTRPIYAAVGSQRLPDYHRLDLRFTRVFTYPTYILSAYVDLVNCYGRKNISGYDYDPAYTSKTPISQLPFFPSFGVKAEF